jgi:hypothetical protein
VIGGRLMSGMRKSKKDGPARGRPIFESPSVKYFDGIASGRAAATASGEAETNQANAKHSERRRLGHGVPLDSNPL